MMRIPPYPKGDGGMQRAWLLVEALRNIGTVHFVLVQRDTDKDLESASLDPLREVVETVTVLPLREWSTTKRSLPWLPWRISVWIDAVRIGSAEAPKLSLRTLRQIAAKLPLRKFDMVFAGRLPSAIIAGSLETAGLIDVGEKLVDFDDIMSRFKERELATRHGEIGLLDRWYRQIDIKAVRKAEAEVSRNWHAVSVCTDDDVRILSEMAPAATFVKIPNVVERPLLGSPLGPASPIRLLFVGTLRFPPNSEGLKLFIRKAWPTIKARLPDAKLTVVGLAPPDELADLLKENEIALFSNVPSVEPFYQSNHAVICPITFGGGTRIKLLEAMAYGRPIVSTHLGAEGLDLVDGRDALLVDDMEGFAAAVIRLAEEPDLRSALASNARALQQERFALPTIFAAVSAMVAKATAKLASAS